MKNKLLLFFLFVTLMYFVFDYFKFIFVENSKEPQTVNQQLNNRATENIYLNSENSKNGLDIHIIQTVSINNPSIVPYLIHSFFTIKALLKNKIYINNLLFTTISKDCDKNDVKTLLNFGANINYRNPDRNNMTPFLYASSYSSVEIINLLEKAGANVYDLDKLGNNAFMLAIKEENIEVAKYLLNKYKYDINYKNLNEQTALNLVLFESLEYVSLEIIEFLIKSGSDVNSCDKYGNTPILYASYKENRGKLLKYLLEQGADINACNNNGETALAIVGKVSGFSDAFRFLTKSGADIKAKDKEGNKIITCVLRGERNKLALFVERNIPDNVIGVVILYLFEFFLGKTCCLPHLFSDRFPLTFLNDL